MKESIKEENANSGMESIDSNIFQSLFDNSISGILYGNPDDGDVYDANLAAAQMFGYSIEELRKLNRNDIFDYGHVSMINSLRERSKSGSAMGELIGIRKNGERFTCEFTSSIFKNEKGESRTCTILSDVSERKKYLEEMTLLLDNTEESFVLVDRDLKILSFNKFFHDQYKFLLKKHVKRGDNILDYSIPERRTSIVHIYNLVLEGQTISDVGEFQKSDGSPFYFSITYKPAKNSDGNIIGIFITTQDITAKTIAIKESGIEKRNREALINLTEDLIWSVNTNFELIAANHSFLNTMKMVVGKDLESGDNLLFNEKIDQNFINYWKQMYLRGFAGEAFKFETVTPSDYTNVVYLEITINPIIDADKIVGVACYSRDITATKIAYEKLSESEIALKLSHEQLTKLTDSINTVVYQFEMTLDGKMTFPFISKSIYKLIPEADVNALKLDATLAFKHVHPKDIEGLINSIYESRDNLSYWHHEYRYVSPDGIEKWVSGSSNPNKAEDGTVVWYGYFQDITEQKRNRESLRNAVERYEMIAKATNDTIWDVDILNNTITWSEGIKSVYGYTDEEPNMFSADWWYSKIHPDEIDHVKMQNELWMKHKHFKLDQEYRFLCADGTYKYVFDRGFLLVDDKGAPIKIAGAMQDITERKNAEKTLKKTLSLLNKTSELAKIGGWEVDLTNNTHYWSPEIYRILEVEANFIPTIDKVLSFFSSESKSIVKNAIKNGIDNGLDWNIELQANTAEGNLIDVKVQGSAVVKKGKTIKILGTLQNITEQKVAARKLRESELRFKTIFDAEPECVKLINAEGEVIEINKAGVKVHEADSEEHIKSIPIAEFILPEYRKAFFDLHRNTMLGNQGFLEFEILGLKGTKRWLEAHSAPIYDDHKNVSMMLSVTRDITERKVFEKALFESQKRFKTIFDTVPECVKLVNAKGDVVEMNDAGLAMLEVDSISTINECRLIEFVLPKYQKKYLELHKKTMAGQECSMEFEVVGKKGNHRWLETRTVPLLDEDSKIDLMLAVTRDITQHKKEEQFLKLLESVVTHTNDSIMITEAEPFDEPGPKIVYVNKAFTKMTGFAPEEVIGKSPRVLQGPKTDKAELKRLSEAIRKWEPCEITIINYKKNGEEYWTNFSVKPVADATGWYTHWIAVERDVTEQKNNEIEKEQIIAELSQNNKDLKQFSYVTSHNLRAPIANLLGLTSLIDQYKVPNKSLKQILDGVRQSALMFDDTVKDLSKVLVIKDQTNIIKESVSFVTVIDNVLKQLSIAMDDHTVKINYKFSDAATVLFTPSYMESILLNLFTNAIKYKSPKRILKVDISSSNSKDFVILKFKDNGIGIDTEKYKDKLFKLYQRFHDNPDGKGLGLYLVKSQVEALGGSIEIESEVNKGTTFIIKFRK